MKSKKSTKFLTALLISMFILSLTISPVFGEEIGDVLRFAGSNRYQTSALVSEQIFESAEYIVLASGDSTGNYADALAGSYLAGFRDAPLLLTYPHTLPSSIRDEIIRLGATKAYILGGETAIHPAVVTELIGLGFDAENIIRLSGARREDTAVEIVQYVYDEMYGTKESGEHFAFIVNGRATADALVAGSYAYQYGIPIFLVATDSLPDVTGQALIDMGFDFVDIIGGTAVISDNLASLLDDLYGVRQRIAGARRYETSTLFAEAMFPETEFFAFINGTDSSLADGISAAAFGIPILYVTDSTVPGVVETYLSSYISGFSRLFILGGSIAVSQSVEDALIMIREDVPPMIADAYIENETGTYRVYADIDNISNTITLEIASDKDHEQFVTGHSLLSKEIYLQVSSTDGGSYDIPSPGRLIQPEDDFVAFILQQFSDNPPTGVNAQTLLANTGSQFTMTSSSDPTNIRIYTLHVVISSI